MPTASDVWLATVARRLGDLASQVVFVGGATIGLLIDDPASMPVRPTDDLDMIVETSSRQRYYELEAELRSRGFQPDSSEGAPMCRWTIDGIKVDVMPTSAEILGFGKIWYADAISHASEHEIEPGLTIRVATATYFLAMKLEAFAGRGSGDYIASHDLEDVIALVDGRDSLIVESKHRPRSSANTYRRRSASSWRPRRSSMHSPGTFPVTVPARRGSLSCSIG